MKTLLYANRAEPKSISVISILLLAAVGYITKLRCMHRECYIKDFPKERYNTYAKSCNSNLYTKYPGATYSGLLLGTMCCL